MAQSQVNHALRRKQIAAARTMIGWGQRRLARRAGIGTSTLATYEIGKHEMSKPCMDVVVQALDEAGVALTERGIELKEVP